MGRLIDADDAVNIFTNRLFETLKTQIPCVTATESQICLETCYKVAKYEVDNIPTAYDVEKVLEALEKEAYNGFDITLSKAIDIVERGGAE